VKVKADVGGQTETVWLIDWEHPERNRFAIAEEVTVKGGRRQGRTKRPDIVLYVNGIALGVLELKRSSVSVSEGIRQNLDNQKKEFIQPSSRPCSTSWPATTPRACATAPSRRPRSTT
jgi:type I restriction enzyme R subunit